MAIAVFVGGVLGTLARAGVAQTLPHDPAGWPWATLLVNVAGAALLGWIVVAIPGGGLARPLLATGVCGALTTFSAFQLELYELVDHGRAGLALAYAAASVLAGLAAVLVAQRWAAR